jgi:hypothetical protein
MGNKLKLHDGYTVRDGEVTFYKDSSLYKIQFPKHLKVDQDKVMAFESMCETYRKSFMEIGWLRLHTPVGLHQESAGTHFLSVPLEHRARIAEMLKSGRLVMLETPATQNEGGNLVYYMLEYAELDPRTYRVIETGKQITLDQLVGDGELFDFLGVSQQNRRMLDSGTITKAEWERQIQIIEQWEKTKFHIESWNIQGMFVEV